MHKNNDKSSALKTEIEEGFYVMRFQNDSAGVVRETRNMIVTVFNSIFVQKDMEISF